MIPFLKVFHYRPDGLEENISPYVLSLQISKGSEATKNTLTLELQNHNGRLNQYDNEEAQITVADSSIAVWLDWESIDTTTLAPIISATVSSIEYPMGNDGKYKLKIKATDKTAMLLSKMWAEAVTENFNWNASDIIINLVGHLNDLDGDSGNGTQLGKTPLTTTNVSTTKHDGTALKRPVAMSKIWKPGYEWLNDLSQPENTGEDRPYVYYIDQYNDLHWTYPYQKPVTTLSSAIDATQTTIPVISTTGYPSTGTFLIEQEAISYIGLTSNSFTGCTRGAKFTNNITHASGTEVSALYLYTGRNNVYSLDIGTTEDGTYNFIIYNGGPTPAGYELLDYSLDLAQVGKKFRMKFFDWKSVGKDIANAEKNRSTWSDAGNTGYPHPGGNPLSALNTWTPWWTSTPVTSDEDYQAAFEAQIRVMCETKCDAYYTTGKQRYKAGCQLKGTMAYEIGDLVNVVSPKFEKILLLRVKDIKHQVNKGSWTTDIELEEDTEAIATNN